MNRQRTAHRRSGAGWSSPRVRAASIIGTALATGVVLLAPATTAALPAPEAPQLSPVLLSVTSSSPDAVEAAAAEVRALGGEVLATYDVAGALLASLPSGPRPGGVVEIPDAALQVAWTTVTRAPKPPKNTDVAGATYRATIGDDNRSQGAGVTVALVDTGVADVADLAGRVEHINVSGDVQGDGLGHGTFLAGLLAGDGTSSGGRYAGVATQARLLDVQVAGADGSTSMSRVLAGLQAIADRAAIDPSLKVVSVALSTGSPLPPSIDPLTRGLEALWRLGLTVVVAAGNDGPSDDTVSSPGNDPLLLTVGSVDEASTSARRDDTIADFSSRLKLHGLRKPEIAAPGVSLISLRAPGSIADVENPGSVVEGSYFRGTGTSMSTAVAAGAVAALLAARPELTPAAVKSLLVGTGYNVRSDRTDGLDLGAAWTADVPSWTDDTFPGGSGTWAASDSDAAAWAAFAAAWQAGDLDGVRAAWVAMSTQARRWAATAWAAAILPEASSVDDAEWEARVAAARRWATEDWNARRWAKDDWAARRWAGDEWLARRWALEDWLARRWAGDEWLARRWAADLWTNPDTDPFSARRWASEDWLAFAWTARRWASADWAQLAWEARAWTARRWAEDEWAAFAWDARRWAMDRWTARRWALLDWSAA